MKYKIKWGCVLKNKTLVKTSILIFETTPNSGGKNTLAKHALHLTKKNQS
jgi:hypothetical protein